MDKDVFLSLICILYRSPISVYNKYGRCRLLGIAEMVEVGRLDRSEQYFSLYRDLYGLQNSISMRDRRMQKMSKKDIEQNILQNGQELIDTHENYEGSELVLKIARSQFGKALNAARWCKTEKQMCYNLATHEIWLLARVFGISGSNKKYVCKPIIDFIQENIYENENEKLTAIEA